MVKHEEIKKLKRILRREVTALCRWNGRRWKLPLTSTIHTIQDNHWPAVFFGGTLRSLLLSRLVHNAPGRPRDIDIVVGSITIEDLQKEFGPWISRRTRFGGLALRRRGWEFDLWPVNETFAFKQSGKNDAAFENLPKTTFLNAEAIAVEVWPKPGKPRRIYSWNDQFFDGVLTKTLELNNPENPYPELCVLRSLVMANVLRWRVGPCLARFLTQHGPRISKSDLIDIQKRHYDSVRLPWENYQLMLGRLLDAIEKDPNSPVDFQQERQFSFWVPGYSHDDKIRVIVRSRVRRSNRPSVYNLSLLEI